MTTKMTTTMNAEHRHHRRHQEPKRTVAISRNRWNRATQASGWRYYLLFDGERYCCLGFVCQQLFGKSDEEMLGMRVPQQVGVPTTPNSRYSTARQRAMQ